VKALLDHFGLRELPFGVTPDPRFLYYSRTHREGLASLRYGVEMNRGFMALIAPPGMGKTTLLFQLMEHLRGAARTSFVFNTQRSAQELVRAVIHDTGIDTRSLDGVELFESFHGLLAQESRAGKQVLLVIDEAQNLDGESLEAVRLLSNFETSSAKLLQIILAGQPELQAKLADASLAQLRQRISLVCRLTPFDALEVEQYIQHRLHLAGARAALFSPDAVALIADYSKGIPRNISNLAFHAMSMAFALDQRIVDSRMVAEAINDLTLEDQRIEIPEHDPGAAQMSLRDDTVASSQNQVRREVAEISEPAQERIPTQTPMPERTSPHLRERKPAGSRSRRHILLSSVAGVLLFGAVVINSGRLTGAKVAAAEGLAAAHSSAPRTFQGATALERRAPEYPRAAVANGVEGKVVVRAYIDPDGSVKQVTLVSGPKLLSDAAIQAVRSWRFKPALQNGVPIADEQDMNFEFRLKQRPRSAMNE
jgi:TonB family protein